MADLVYISAASIWEACIKIKQGRLEANIDDLYEGIDARGFVELPIST